jgi:phthiocerol/phenolphthiocerol synthesis type-I polyketide synthase E
MRTNSIGEIETAVDLLWREILGPQAAQLSPDLNFFTAGGDSLRLTQLMARVNALFFAAEPDRELPITDFFTYTSVRELSRRIAESTKPHPPQASTPPYDTSHEAIAIIGMAGRFPGSANVEAFWTNLCDGRDTLANLSESQLLTAGVTPSELARPGYVRRAGLLEDVRLFDAELFELTPTEAVVTSPEQRLLLECAHEALEHGGYATRWNEERTGVFVGSGLSTYLLYNCATETHQLESAAGMRLLAANTSAATRISYVLGLTGPSLTLDTACSSSLVAVHLARRALLNAECDLALAGGATVRRFAARGYLAEAGNIFSPDGHCRPFDRQAQGTVGSSGSALILMKRLRQALGDGDTIHAVIRSTAINNDGRAKAGYTAPSASGQAGVIRTALAEACVNACDIGLLETHGTATRLGDLIEVAALKDAMGSPPAPGHRCALGTLKANVGHMEAAAGIGGLIKAALAVRHGLIPPAIGTSEINPELALERTPFYLNPTLQAWPSSPTPRRAGVSSFGIGGTNAHAILEEPPPSSTGRTHRSYALLTLSARSAPLLQRRCEMLMECIRGDPTLRLSDMAFTLQMGHRAHEHRTALVCASNAEALSKLERESTQRVKSSRRVARAPEIVFMFPGQGSQYPGMCRGLYDSEPVFRDRLDACARHILNLTHTDIRRVLFETAPAEPSGAAVLARTEVCQPALFAVEWALACLWQAWGVVPSIMIGHSLGEYVAACVSGTLCLEDALMIVCARGRLMQGAPPGRMLAVQLSCAELTPLLPTGCTFAAINAPAQSVVSGDAEGIATLEAALRVRAIPSTEVSNSHAFHSPLMDGILDDLRATLNRARFQPIRIPFVSNVTGKRLEIGITLQPEYWVRHARQPVQFAAGVQDLLPGGPRIFLEVGPGTVLSGCVRRLPGSENHALLASCRHPRETRPDAVIIASTLGQLWTHGVSVDWASFNRQVKGRRIPLPTTLFERKLHWQEPAARTSPAAENPAPAAMPALDILGTPDSAARRPGQAIGNETDRLQSRVADLWKELLGVRPATMDEDFFELGGDSLLAVQMNAQLAERFGGQFTLRELLAEPTVAAIARLIVREHREHV